MRRSAKVGDIYGGPGFGDWHVVVNRYNDEVSVAVVHAVIHHQADHVHALLIRREDWICLGRIV